MRQAGHTSQPSDLAPEIKNWVDNCFIPILVKDYLGGARKTLATEAEAVSHSTGQVTSQSEVDQ